MGSLGDRKEASILKLDANYTISPRALEKWSKEQNNKKVTNKKPGVCMRRRALGLHSVILVLGCVAGTGFEEIVIWFNVISQVDNLASGQLLDGIQGHLGPVMIGAFEMAGQADLADVLAALGGILRRDFVLGENGQVGAFRDACTAGNAGIGGDLLPGPLADWLTRDNALHRADFDTAAVADAQAGNDMGHFVPPLLVR